MNISNIVITIMTGIATGLVVAAIVAMINIKIKYAKSETEAKRSVAFVFWKIIYGCALCFVALVLFKELNTSEPLTRTSLVNILLACFTLFSSFMAYIFLRVFRILQKNLSMFEMGGYIDQKLIQMIKGLPCQPQDNTHSLNNANEMKNNSNNAVHSVAPNVGA